MSAQGYYIDRSELVAVYNLVGGQLEQRPLESLRDAATRVFRHNCAPQVTLDVARLVLELEGKPSEHQWRLLSAAAAMIRASRSS